MEAIIATLGCRLNRADEALLTDRLARAGFVVVLAAQAASPALIVLNTCCVTAEAERKSRQAARRFRQRWPQARLVVTGCAAELDPEAWDELGDLVLTNSEKRGIVDAIPNLLAEPRKIFTVDLPKPKVSNLQKYFLSQRPAEPVDAPPADAPLKIRHRAMRDAAPDVFAEEAWSRFPNRSRAFIKIQEGCDNFCTYCIVPVVRGPERSRAFTEVMADCRQAIAAGFPELVLTGVNTCAYADGPYNLGKLLVALGDEPGNFRLRLGSTEPHPANSALPAVMAGIPKMCHFLHLSLQHGCDRVLERMNRHYTTAQYAAFTASARALMPELHLGTDVIVGFPGETDDDFETMMEFVASQYFANIHIFRFSPRPGTPAADFPRQVPAPVADARFRRLRKLADLSAEHFAQTQYGKRRTVIFEEARPDGFQYGWSDNYLKIRVPAGGYPLREVITMELTPENISAERETIL